MSKVNIQNVLVISPKETVSQDLARLAEDDFDHMPLVVLSALTIQEILTTMDKTHIELVVVTQDTPNYERILSQVRSLDNKLPVLFIRTDGNVPGSILNKQGATDVLPPSYLAEPLYELWAEIKNILMRYSTPVPSTTIASAIEQLKLTFEGQLRDVRSELVKLKYDHEKTQAGQLDILAKLEVSNSQLERIDSWTVDHAVWHKENEPISESVQTILTWSQKNKTFIVTIIGVLAAAVSYLVKRGLAGAGG